MSAQNLALSPAPDSDWMSRLSQRKLHSAATLASRDNLTLHRWVLLKNLLLSSSSSQLSSSHTSESQHSPPFEYSSSPAEEEVFVFPDADIFEFPDAASLNAEAAADEAAWFDAVMDELEELEDDDEFDVASETDDDRAANYSVAFPASSVPAPHTRVTAPELSLPLFPASPSPTSTPSSFVLSECNCITPPPTPTRTPSLIDDLPFGDCDSVGDSSDDDDESEGLDTPLTLSQTVGITEPAVVIPESEAYSYFFRQPISRSPLSPSSPPPFPLQQEC
ncbi:hypothetical protein BKA62DRAFT_132087 [Auriculariales sp. MPI-PUGE-AT-0066]|nr:hypothetical protein BKA62DRAFT_132087 [Auriculariales sp. MPI-PUGE-AT-0066]